MRQKISLFLSFLILLFCMQTSFAADSIKVIINGSQIKFDAEPEIENGRTLVPLRAIFEALNATVSWDDTTRTVTGIKNDKTIILKVDSTNATINRENKTLDVPASMHSNRIFVPLRFISESLGSEVKWDSSTKTITINDQTKQLKQLIVDFIDVGQADSILIQTPNGSSLLIDAGNNSDENTIISYIKSKGISKIDTVIATHPHEDHIGSMDSVVNQFDIGSIYMPKVSTNTKTFEDLLNAISKKGLKVNTAFAGVKIEIDPSVNIEFLAPNSTSYEDLNNYSAVIKLTYESTAFLFTGDAESTSEHEMTSKGYDLRADLLKVGHHGSGTSTTALFLKKVSPKYAVISVGKDNSYGHPDNLTLNRLKIFGIEAFRTDEAGTIVVTSDSKTIKLDKKASAIKENAPPTMAPDPTISPTPEQKKSEYTIPQGNYIGNKNTNKFHKSSCGSLPAPKNQVKFSSREEAINNGYVPCKICNP